MNISSRPVSKANTFVVDRSIVGFSLFYVICRGSELHKISPDLKDEFTTIKEIQLHSKKATLQHFSKQLKSMGSCFKMFYKTNS